MRAIKPIFLLTAWYPFRETGENFLSDELRCLGSDAAHVSVLAVNPAKRLAQLQPVPDAVRAETLFAAPFSRINKLRCVLQLTAHGEFWEELSYLWRTGRLNLKNVRALIAFCARGVRIARALDARVRACEEKPVLCSYWMLDTAYAAALLARRFGLAAVTRAHGGDLYEERSGGYLPMRRFILRQMRLAAPVSKMGCDYLKRRYPGLGNVQHRYLGAADPGTVREPEGRRPFRILSCAFLKPLKRIPLIAEALALIGDAEIEWTHFGDGEDMQALRAAAESLPQNVRVTLMGSRPPEEIAQYCRETDVHLYVNVSTTEGIPVSIMEAMRFGIPALATDVGGTRELVRDGESGVLLPADLTARTLADAIESFLRMPEERYLQYRHDARAVWERDFRAETNYPNFYCELQTL